MSNLSEADVQRIVAAVQAAQATPSLHRDEASGIALAAARTAVQENNVRLFSLLGYDVANADDVKRLRAALGFLDTMHCRSMAVGKAMSNAIAVAVALFILGLLALGAKGTIMSWLGHGPPPPPNIK